MSSEYHDRWIDCTADEVVIRGYYFPWGSKHIPYADIHGVRTVTLSALRGKPRIWGTANPGHWANLDPKRPRKQFGLVLDLGRRVQPLITPDDPERVSACIESHSNAEVHAPTGERAPFV